jgi:hypothetical protein
MTTAMTTALEPVLSVRRVLTLDRVLADPTRTPR